MARTTRDLCQDCWQAAHPDEYCPELGRYGTCAGCGAAALITRSRIADETPTPCQHRPDRNAPTAKYPARCLHCGITLSDQRKCSGTRNGRHSWMAMMRDGDVAIVCSAPGCGLVK